MSEVRQDCCEWDLVGTINAPIVQLLKRLIMYVIKARDRHVEFHVRLTDVRDQRRLLILSEVYAKIARHMA